MFERCYVNYALELARKEKMTQLDFAKKIWPDKSEATANTTIVALKKQNSRGKPQNLRVSDAIRMAEVLGREYPSLTFEVWERLKLTGQEALANPVESKVPPKKEAQPRNALPLRQEALQGHIEKISQE